MIQMNSKQLQILKKLIKPFILLIFLIHQKKENKFFKIVNKHMI